MRRILVVEEDEAARQAMQLALRQAGYAAEGVATAVAAARALDAEGFGAVLAPASAALSAELQRRRPDTAVIALVASGDDEAGLRALRVGAQDYLVRPVEAAALVAAVR